MTSKHLRRAALAFAVAITFIGAASAGVLAQDYQGSVVTIGGGNSGVDGGDTVVIAPGVTISGGEVINATGIGVDSGGGSSIGGASGGDTNASVVE